MARLKMLAIAAGTGRVGCVFFIGNRLRHWQMSVKASKTPQLAAKQASIWIDALKPDVVITEKLGQYSRKGPLTRHLVGAIATVANKKRLNDVMVPRIQNFANKYEEAAELANRYPDILPWLPKRPRIWESEPRNMIYFEAIALVVSVFDKIKAEKDNA